MLYYRIIITMPISICRFKEGWCMCLSNLMWFFLSQIGIWVYSMELIPIEMHQKIASYIIKKEDREHGKLLDKILKNDQWSCNKIWSCVAYQARSYQESRINYINNPLSCAGLGFEKWRSLTREQKDITLKIVQRTSKRSYWFAQDCIVWSYSSVYLDAHECRKVHTIPEQIFKEIIPDNETLIIKRYFPLDKKKVIEDIATVVHNIMYCDAYNAACVITPYMGMLYYRGNYAAIRGGIIEVVKT